MAKLIHTRNGRWFTSLFFFIVAAATLFLALANPGSKVAAQVTPSAPIYTTGSFTFSAPLELTGHPASPAFFQQDGEPEIKVDIFGNIYVTGIQGVPGGVDLWKSINKGTSFVYMGQPDGAQDHCQSLPQCNGLGGGDDQIDVSSGGYLYVSSLWGGSVTMSTSYDGGTGGVEPGQAWQVDPAAATVGGLDDRQWVAAYGPQTLYLSYLDATSGIDVQKSTDGGKTFGPPTQPYDVTSALFADEQGNMVVDQYNGNVYLTFIPNGANNQIYLARSTDGGATWSLTLAYDGPANTTNIGVFPILAVDRGGNLHLAFTNSNATSHANCHVILTSTANPAAASPTWTTAVQIDSGSASNSSVMPWIVAGSPGIVDVTWLGSTAAQPGVVNSTWHVFFAQVTNALTGSPTIAQNQVETAVMHNHSICFNGSGCAGADPTTGGPHTEPENRDMLEYYTMTLDPDGNAHIAYSDSVNNCPTSTCATNAWFSKQTSGAGAYTPPAAPAPATFAANLALASLSGDAAAEPDIAVDSHNCIYAASNIGIGNLGPPHFWASENQGLSFRDTVPPPATGTGDEYIAMIPQQSGARNDELYYTDLAVADVSIFKSTDRGMTWAGTTAAYGHLDASSDRQWIRGERIGTGGASQVLYEMDHEAVAEAIRFSASIDDSAWSPPASGITAPEMILPPDNTFPNTNPGPLFIDKTTHMVYGVFTASTIKTNSDRPPFGKLPNVWLAFGAGSTIAGVPPGPFTNVPAFKGVFDSPASPGPTPPPGSETIGSNAANDFPGGAVDAAGNIYVVWATPNSRTGQFSVWFASSHDHGQNFYGPFEVAKFTAPPVGSAEMPWIAAGDNGRVDIVYYQSNEAGDPNSTNLHWNTMFAQSLNANSREPVFTISQASDHIMHFGPICNLGLLCNAGTRELLDFFEVAIGPDGLANIVFADTGNANSPSHATYARQASGPLALTNPTFPTCLPIPQLISLVSRKTHTGLTPPGDLPLSLTAPFTIEPRSGGIPSGNHTLVFTFANTLTSVSSITATATTSSGTQSVTCSSGGISGTQYTVNCTGVPNASHLAVTLNTVADTAGNSGTIGPVHMDVLFGDVSASGRTDAGDVTQVRNRTVSIPVTTDPASFRYDVNISGRIDAGDVTATRNATVTVLPP
jgi:hypothetical protein